MTVIYVVAAILGLPLVAYAVFAGDGDTEGPELGDGGIVGYLSLGTLSFLAGFFGLTGLLVGLVAGPAATFVLAVVVGLVAAGSHRLLLRYLAGSSASSHLADADLAGRRATVVVPVSAGARGRVMIELGDQRHYLTARLAPGDVGDLDAGRPAVVVDVEAGVATITALDPELA